jgi:DNA-binding transcriptional LysR family regulator
MRFKGLDLNLLAAFDVLLESRSVSAAARQMNLSQPAMSAALTRLRDYFADDLLVAQGKRMYPTAFAEALVPQVRETLRTVEAMLATTSRFDPAATQRTFRLVASDYVVTAVLAPVLQALPRLAPGLRIELVLPSDAAQSDLRDGRADLLIAPEQFILSDHPSELLCEERHVVVGWADNPAFAAGGPISTLSSPPAMFRCGSAPRAIMPLPIANSTRWALSAAWKSKRPRSARSRGC